MRVYVAGPMSGIVAFNFPAFDAAEALLRAMGHDPVNPAAIDRDLDGFDPVVAVALPHEHYMKRDLPLVAGCDAMALLPGWSESRGARAEVTVGLLCGLAFHYVRDGDLAPASPSSVRFALLSARPEGAVA